MLQAEVSRAYVKVTRPHSGCPLELHLTTSELWFGQEQEGILP